MKNNKGKSILGLLIVILVIAACGFVAFKGVDESGQGSVKNIKLGLDLAGGDVYKRQFQNRKLRQRGSRRRFQRP